jgi:hypothetical protein
MGDWLNEWCAINPYLTDLTHLTYLTDKKTGAGMRLLRP